ncbi:hypothetical protein ACA910_007889 [Epithemia clementina (nom. ined.)]
MLRRSFTRYGILCQRVVPILVIVGYILSLAFLIIDSRHLSHEPSTNLEFKFLTGSIENALQSPIDTNSVSCLEPFDLSVNQLQVVPFWHGALPSAEIAATSEDFLPIVTAGEVDLTFRLRPIPSKHNKNLDSNCVDAIQGISAYQIIAERAHAPHVSIWNSGKIQVDNEKERIPSSIEWDYRSAPLTAGSIVRWKVLVWDALGDGPAASNWSKFGIGPDSENWAAQWITHPRDYATLFNGNGEPRVRGLKNLTVSEETCSLWHHRQPLPVARVQFEIVDSHNIVAALLVATGLGMFSVSMNGKRLSSSSLHDPPLTAFAQRVSYRGFDVTQEIQQRRNHAIAIELGSGWWDHRPINGAIVYMDFMPKGSLTAIAQLHVSFRNGTTVLLAPTGADGKWKIGKGSLLESNLFTGEKIDLKTEDLNRGWDTVMPPKTSSIDWVVPEVFESGSVQAWRSTLEAFAVYRKKGNLSAVAPIGSLVPLEIPPVLPVDKIAPVSTASLGSGRWLLDFGRGMSGVLRFENGLPEPKEPEDGVYPRAHNLSMTLSKNDRFISVVYGDSLELATGDIALALVAGFGHHAGGEKGVSKRRNVDQRGGPCFPPEDLAGYQALTQRDVFIVPGNAQKRLFKNARQPRFTVHGFRYAEICCSESPPADVFAIQYRTAYQVWGQFGSSNPVFNGVYEMTRNSLESNTLGIQSDCPHRERLQYGGDIVASSPAALHMFDMAAFYRKVVHDWTDSQFSNGAYGVTSVFMNLLSTRSVGGRGSGETVWASIAPVLTARLLRHYGDQKMVKRTLGSHAAWLDFLARYWEEGMERMYGKEADLKSKKGLGDWLALAASDSWFTHNVFFLATARSVAYLANKILELDSRLATDQVASSAYQELLSIAIKTASQLEESIRNLYKGDKFPCNRPNCKHLAEDLGLFTRIVEGRQRCLILINRLRIVGDEHTLTWSGQEDVSFNSRLKVSELASLLSEGHIVRMDGKIVPAYNERYAVTTGMLGMRYTLKTLSDNGFHSLALTKSSGSYMPSFGMMLSFNATTLWETIWRSEDLYSRNHAMMGGIAEWLAASVAGISLSPTTVGGRELLFWPRIPSTFDAAAIVDQASATQGTKAGTAAIAWRLQGNKVTTRRVVIRILVPPGSRAELRLPPTNEEWHIQRSLDIPDFDEAQAKARALCEQRRKKKEGFPFHWHYDRKTKEFYRVYEKKTIGTPCDSFLFTTEASWQTMAIIAADSKGNVPQLNAGFFQVTMNQWQLHNDTPVHGYESFNGDPGPFCSDPTTFDWDINDAEHLV